jgi:hypothetical protein
MKRRRGGGGGHGSATNLASQGPVRSDPDPLRGGVCCLQYCTSKVDDQHHDKPEECDSDVSGASYVMETDALKSTEVRASGAVYLLYRDFGASDGADLYHVSQTDEMDFYGVRF